MNLANLYRPSKFDDVIGQDNIVKILKNQIGDGNIKNAYLFVGSAGTGKTTCGRILATEINGSTSNIIEIDAASNTGIDNIRDLREQCKFQPIGTTYKVYLIDECHMLSTGAWNGFLKTLEEPPKHCVFILCTTDPQKIPATILSRCQRFDFKRVDADLIAIRLDAIARKEKINISEEAVQYIAKIANGGVRAAISLLDTCASYNNKLALSDVITILGTVAYDCMFNILTAVQKEDKRVLIGTIQALYDNGKDLKIFVQQFMEFLIDIEKYKVTNDMNLIKIGNQYEEEIKSVSIDTLKLFDTINTFYGKIKYEANIKYLLEGELLCVISGKRD